MALSLTHTHIYTHMNRKKKKSSNKLAVAASSGKEPDDAGEMEEAGSVSLRYAFVCE